MVRALAAWLQRRPIHLTKGSSIVPVDKPGSEPDIFAKAANGKTASSYHPDGRWNIGGWTTYPSADALAANAAARPAATPPAANPGTPRKS
jgi:hypothetical protein